METDRLKLLRAGALSASLLVANPGISAAENKKIDQIDEQHISQPQKENEINYQKVLYYARKYLNIDDISNLKYFYEQLAQNPEESIERAETSDIIDQNQEEVEHYIFYVNDKNKDKKSDQWSMQLIINNSMPRIEIINIAIVIDKNGRVFDGDENSLGQLFEHSPNIMATTCDLVFNTPVEMKGLEYIGESYDDSQPFYMSKDHIDNQGNQYTQMFTGDNLIVMGAAIKTNNIDLWEINSNPLIKPTNPSA